MTGLTCVITACKRLHLFRRTMTSFLAQCVDHNLITHWLLVDNGSTDEDIAAMQAEFPMFRDHLLDTRGRSYIEMRHAMYRAVATPQVFVLEDDWEFYRPGHLIRMARAIMDDDPTVKEVAYRYFPCPVVHGKDVTYRLHDYCGCTGPNPDLYDSHWPGFTFNPSIQDVAAVSSCLGNIEHRCEHTIAVRFRDAGHRLAHTHKGYCRHIGHETSAFSLTGASR